ncbi:hypothetical protein F5Y15DRAFT_416768 [Xylariaceae sp. FL0016]|nr:hypothetical protein F5Y15DRAFT_416768 [Xylariaceae sp. FL0016]
MQFFAVLALATAALAAPADVSARNYGECAPATYACKPDGSGWLVCNVDSTWLDGGICPKGTGCTYESNNLPYCE